MLIERPHTGIDEGKPRLALDPCRQPLRIGAIGADAIIGAMKIFNFKTRLILKLLHEVAVPMLASGEGGKRCAPAF